ncbi:uncharacterized protein C8A04DRAFT_13502 [Dichotomopilus funicola]|uniref:FAD-binding domain-containing protein n=1 Tax=Dichotomopilus funicola TaxID=1934379 RepID=A0AAN6UZN4_9PEZI|nr:hypothetical protein C8A04DRAFT_13502 [Dichotomopilus funicola]
MTTPTNIAEDGLHVVIIGAGLAGLSTALSTKLANPAHRVTVLEATRELTEVGAGLQLTPNGTRLLNHWSVFTPLQPLAAVPAALSVHRFDGTRLLAHEPDLKGHLAARYGADAPLWNVHRADLQKALADRCNELGVRVKLGRRALKVDFERAVVLLAGGEDEGDDGAVVQGDVVVLTDGLWSGIRGQFLKRPSPVLPTRDLAYRITIQTDALAETEASDELKQLIRTPAVRFWIGPRAHCVGYPVRAGKVYNLVLLCPDDLPSGVMKGEGDLDEMMERFAGWDPLLVELLKQVKSVVHKWRLMWLDALPEWANQRGTFFMAGDCCHPMLPYLAQGANSSLEDGAVLGSLLGRVKKSERERQLPCVSRMYQQLRMERGRKIQLESFKQRDDIHLEDGEEQEKRDALMVSMLGGELKAPFPSRWTCPDIQPFLYAYDAYAEAEKAYQESPY